MDKEMSHEEILEKVCGILHEEFEIENEDLQPQAHLFEDLELDSLDAVDLIVALEKLFAFRAQEERAKELRTIEDIVHFILENQKMVKEQQGATQS
ncbi:acyl carrier protein [Candidatus Uabimicrobium amorphum]|uniref:Acyl carrier protein n=1 Tax=Uabimicrobium amorphum TaxID=2596890 RepID=A0A5S9INI2_UABAM|nr:acyl carrier protein [Candidatus Uabimicrobium amorphum]BBM85163.1 acyl carrier protein [Candidatus Uabimicrobium amorphum]